jgi:catechol 2,3-dioxygenase-like lactoylglutathione lyase family enzyme
MIVPTAIDHTCLIVRSLAKTRAYYESLFDLTCAAREGDPATLAVESPHVHFFVTEVPDAPADFLQRQHLSFTVEDLSAVTSRLAAAGQTFTTGAVAFFKHHNYRWCEWRDPDGIRLECVSALP